MRRAIAAITVASTVLIGAGCGGPDHVTYVDPNPASAYSAGGTSTSNPFLEYGGAAELRAGAVHRFRGELDLASIQASAAPANVAKAVSFARDDAYAQIRPELELRAPAVVRTIDAALASLSAARAGANMNDVHAQITALAERITASVDPAVVPTAARQDAGFRAAVVATTLADAASDAEGAVADDGSGVDASSVDRAQAAVLDARTRGLQDVPFNVRAGIADRLATLLTTSFTRTGHAFPAEHIASELNDISDDINSAARVDPTLPEPTAATPGLLRSVKRAVGTALESEVSGNRTAALRQLHAAAIGPFDEAASGLASVDPDLLVQIQQLLVIDLPQAVQRGAGEGTYATSLDARLDDAVGRVEDELEAQRAAS